MNSHASNLKISTGKSVPDGTRSDYKSTIKTEIVKEQDSLRITKDMELRKAVIVKGHGMQRKRFT